MSEGPPTTDVELLQGELAEVAREIARLLLQPEHESADVALDIRAGALRRQIAEARPRALASPDLWVGGIGGRLVSGG